LKPFKFLGFEYDGNKKLFYANTRKGSKLIYNRQQMVDLIRNRELMDVKSISKEILTTFNFNDVLSILTPIKKIKFDESGHCHYHTKDASYIITKSEKDDKE